MLRQRLYKVYKQRFPKILKKFDVEYSPTGDSAENEEKYVFMLYLSSLILFVSSMVIGVILVIVSLIFKITLIPAAIVSSFSIFLMFFMASLSFRSQKITKKIENNKNEKVNYKVTTVDFLIPATISIILLGFFIIGLL